MSNFLRNTIDRFTGFDEVLSHVDRLIGENSGAGTLRLHAAIERGLGADGHEIVHDPELRKRQYTPLGFNLVDEEHGTTLLDPALPVFRGGDFVNDMPGQTDVVNGTVPGAEATDPAAEFARVISFPDGGAAIAIRGAMQADAQLAA